MVDGGDITSFFVVAQECLFKFFLPDKSRYTLHSMEPRWRKKALKAYYRDREREMFAI